MRSTVHHIENMEMPDSVSIWMVQADVVVKSAHHPYIKFDFTNHSFTFDKFTATMEIFHENKGDIIIFPEYYMPPAFLDSSIGYITASAHSSKIYIIPLSHLTVEQFRSICKSHSIIDESISSNGIVVNAALIFIANVDRSITIYAQLKSLPAFLESYPFMNLHRSNTTNIWKIGNHFSFSVFICYDFIGKTYISDPVISALKPYIKMHQLDYLFVPEWNPEPTHNTYIETLKQICDDSEGSLAIYMVNVARKYDKPPLGEKALAGESSIIDLFPERIDTHEYDMRSLDIPNYLHLIICHQSERVIIRNAEPPIKRRNQLSPRNPRDIFVKTLKYEGKWIPVENEVKYIYKSSKKPSDSDVNRELPLDIEEIDFEADEKRLLHHGDLNRIFDITVQFASARLIDRVPLTAQQRMGILKIMGEYHDLHGCSRASLAFYNELFNIAQRIHDTRASIVALFLIMQAASRVKAEPYQRYAFRIAEKLYPICNDSRYVNMVGKLSLSIISDVALVLSHYNNSFDDMYNFGLFKSADAARLFNESQTHKIDKVERLLDTISYSKIIESMDESDPRYLHFQDASGLVRLVNCNPEKSLQTFEGVKKRVPELINNYGQYLATKHNEILCLHLYGTADKNNLYSSYMELMEEQRVHGQSISATTASNLAALVGDPEFEIYLKSIVSYGIPPHIHKSVSRKKASEIYGIDYSEATCFRKIIYDSE